MPAQTQTAGSISGTVRDAGTGAPLSNVRISLPGSEVATTDSEGRFRLADVAPGPKRVWASDSVRGASAGVSVMVRAGEEAAVEIRLKPGGSISGRVVDSGGQPVARVVVLLLDRRYRYRDLVYSPDQSVATDERGEYRLERVAAEQGLLILVKKPLQAAAPDRVPPYDGRERVLLPTFYGNSAGIAGAQTVVLASGEHRERVDLRMADTPAYCIEGTVDGAGTAKEIFVSLTEQLSFDSGWSLTPATVKANAEGAFRACGLHAGEYRMMATSAPPGNGLAERISGWAATAIAWGSAIVTDQDVSHVKLLASGPVAIAGDASFDPAPRDKSTRIDVSLMRFLNGGAGYADSVEKPAASGVFGGVGSAGGAVGPGAFSLGRWRPGDYQLRVSRLPAGCYVKEAQYGRQDLLHGLLRVGEGAGGERVRLVIGCDGGSLTARVMDRDGNPVPQAILYLFDSDVESPGALAESLQRAEVMSGWSTQLTALRPGKYLVLASDLDVSPAAASVDDIEKLWRAKKEAQEVEIGPRGMVQVTIGYSVGSRSLR
jgi:hypothetical protein